MVTPNEMSRGQIEEVIEAFVSAAERCTVSGVDIIEIHGAQ